MADLKPCPFCGGEGSITTYRGSETIFYIECKNCKALMGNPRTMISALKGKLYFENEAELTEAWNTRKPMEVVVAELEKKLGDTNFEKATQEVNESFYEGLAYAYGMAIEVIRNGGKE